MQNFMLDLALSGHYSSIIAQPVIMSFRCWFNLMQKIKLPTYD
jgi:hypothetical protein